MPGFWLTMSRPSRPADLARTAGLFMNRPRSADLFSVTFATTLAQAVRDGDLRRFARAAGPLTSAAYRRQVTRMARRIAYGGGVTGLAGLAGYGVLWSEAKLARRWIKPPEVGGPHPAGHYGAGLSRPLRLAVLGDSSGVGMGCATPAETPGALLAEALAAQGRDVLLDVLAVVGSQTGDLEPQVSRALLQPPHVAIIMIGANDVTHRVSPHAAATDLYRAVVRLRAQGVRVVVGTCPDLSAVRPIGQPLRWLAGVRSRAMASAQAIAATAAGGVAVPLGELLVDAFSRDPAYFCADRFHPSAAGYAALMAAMLPEVAAAADRAMFAAPDRTAFGPTPVP